MAHFASRFVAWGLATGVGVVAVVELARRTEWLDWKSALLAIVALGLLPGGIILGGVVLRVFSTHYRISSQRLFVRRGLSNQTLDQTELIRVDDVRIHKTVVDRAFGLGSVAIVSSDFTDGELRMEGIREPESVAEAVRGAARSLRQRAMYVETL